MGKDWFLSCTFGGGNNRCRKESPHMAQHGHMVSGARRAGWRVWGAGEPDLVDGEALCPTHAKVKPRPPAPTESREDATGEKQ